MAKVRFNVDSGANIKSNNSEEFDTVEDLGCEEGEWENEMSEDERWKMVKEWSNNHVDIFYEDIE